MPGAKKRAERAKKAQKLLRTYQDLVVEASFLRHQAGRVPFAGHLLPTGCSSNAPPTLARRAIARASVSEPVRPVNVRHDAVEERVHGALVDQARPRCQRRRQRENSAALATHRTRGRPHARRAGGRSRYVSKTRSGCRQRVSGRETARRPGRPRRRRNRRRAPTRVAAEHQQAGRPLRARPRHPGDGKSANTVTQSATRAAPASAPSPVGRTARPGSRPRPRRGLRGRRTRPRRLLRPLPACACAAGRVWRWGCLRLSWAKTDGVTGSPWAARTWASPDRGAGQPSLGGADLADGGDVVLGVASMTAGQASRDREAVAGLPHPQRGRAEVGASRQVADGEPNAPGVRIVVGVLASAG